MEAYGLKMEFLPCQCGDRKTQSRIFALSVWRPVDPKTKFFLIIKLKPEFLPYQVETGNLKMEIFLSRKSIGQK